MFKARKSSFRKNMAILVCAAFIFVAFPEATQAATKPSSRRCPILEDSFPFISAVFSFASLNLSTPVYDLAFFYSLSNNKPKPPYQVKRAKGKKNGPNLNGSISGLGNSTSTKEPQGKDDT